MASTHGRAPAVSVRACEMPRDHLYIKFGYHSSTTELAHETTVRGWGGGLCVDLIAGCWLLGCTQLAINCCCSTTSVAAVSMKELEETGLTFTINVAGTEL